MKTNEELEKEIEQLKHELCELRLKLMQQPTMAPIYIYPPVPCPQPYLYWQPYYIGPTCHNVQATAVQPATTS